MITNRGPELIRRNREIGVSHLPGQRFAQRLVEASRAIDVPFIARHEKRREKGDALDVIPMCVANEDVTPQGLGAARN